MNMGPEEAIHAETTVVESKSRLEQLAGDLLARADIQIGGQRPWDLQIHHADFFSRVLSQGSLGLGESYQQGWWDCGQIDALIARMLSARLDREVRHRGLVWLALKARLSNPQSIRRAWQVGREHYDLGNTLFERMLGPSMAYSCGYWANARTLDEAQAAKHDLVCRKLGLQPGMRLLDIGCGWGGLMRHAAEHYGAHCVGLTISREQAEFVRQRAQGLAIQVELIDYRRLGSESVQGFDRVASIGMFEHVGLKNYRSFFDAAVRHLAPDGLMLLHTIGKNRRGLGVDPWIEKYIFPNGSLPAIGEISDAAEAFFVIEDVHNFGADYDSTLMAWHDNFEKAWPSMQREYSPGFYRTWRYYLLVCAGTFRVRDNQLWQFVLSPRGRPGGYRRPLR
jgi:cyclopropane-fatty-acyl-phospholipid synthase